MARQPMSRLFWSLALAVALARCEATLAPEVVPPMCVSAIDLAVSGDLDGLSTVYTGTNIGVPVTSPMLRSCGVRSVGAVVFRYTMRNTATPEATVLGADGSPFSPLVWFLDRCTLSTMPTGCGRSRARSTERISAGRSVYVVVGGDTTGPQPNGRYTLRITEFDAEIPVGRDCQGDDPTGGRCVAGATCLYGADGTGTGRCVDRNVFTSCRSTSPTCDDGFVCVVGSCRPVLPLGGRCFYGDDVCVAGAHCTALVGPAVGVQRCRPDGSPLGQCRTAPGDAPCDVGLACGRSYTGQANSRCLPIVAEGSVCNPRVNACPAGSQCTNSNGVIRCRFDGALDGFCRTTPPHCDAGLDCTGSVCEAQPHAGDVCRIGGSPCPEHTQCRSRGRQEAHCLTEGELEGPCAPLETCAAGLVCLNNACLRQVALGAACDPNGGVVCVNGTTCVAGVCAANGGSEARCRSDEPFCDEGLTCDEGGTCGPPCTAGCPMGWSCGAMTIPRDVCRRDGASGGACRFGGGMTPCEPGFACSLTGRCEIGECRTPCASGTTCLFADQELPYCVTDGTHRGACRTGAMPCDSGLRCGDAHRCVAADLGLGDHCGEPWSHACPDGSFCVGMDYDRRCEPPNKPAQGTFGSACNSSIPGTCNPGFRCNNLSIGICVYAAEPGEACDDTHLCPTGSPCIAGRHSTICAPVGAPGGRCRRIAGMRACDVGECDLFGCPIAPGDVGGLCRTAPRTAPCDAGLMCNGYPFGAFCVEARAMGATCDPTGATNDCAPPAVCDYFTGTTATCGLL